MRLDQSANPVVVWSGLVSRVSEVIMETWNMRKSNTPLRLDRGHELVDSGIISPVNLMFIVTSL